MPEHPAYQPCDELIEINNNYGVKRRHIDRSKVTAVSQVTFRDITATVVKTGLRVTGSSAFDSILIENVTVGKALNGAGGVAPAATVRNYVVGGVPVTFGNAQR